MSALVYSLLVVAFLALPVVTAVVQGVQARRRRRPAPPSGLASERLYVVPAPVATPAPVPAPVVRPVRLEDLTDELIEQVLTVHYRQVLADPSMQSMWRRLLREASAVRTLKLA